MKPVLGRAESCCVYVKPKNLCNTYMAEFHSCLTIGPWSSLVEGGEGSYLPKG